MTNITLPPAVPEEPALLLALSQKVQPAEFVLTGDLCTLGRSATCDVVVVEQKTVSRLHAKIEREDAYYTLLDANSANGTFVNGRRIQELHILQHDDVIGLGTATALLRFNDPDPTELVQNLLYDEQAMLFSVNRQPLDLTPYEFRFLHHLYRHAGQVCTRESCAEAIWTRAYDPGPDDENLDRIVSNIRRKLRRLDSTIDLAKIIKTRRGLGYELNI